MPNLCQFLVVRRCLCLIFGQSWPLGVLQACKFDFGDTQVAGNSTCKTVNYVWAFGKACAAGNCPAHRSDKLVPDGPPTLGVNTVQQVLPRQDTHVVDACKLGSVVVAGNIVGQAQGVLAGCN